MHHIAVAAQDFDAMLADAVKRGIALPLSGEFEGVRVAYLDTDRDQRKSESGTDAGPEVARLIGDFRVSCRISCKSASVYECFPFIAQSTVTDPSSRIPIGANV